MKLDSVTGKTTANFKFMEIEQCILEQPVSHWRKHGRIFKIPRIKWKQKHSFLEPLGHSKSRSNMGACSHAFLKIIEDTKNIIMIYLKVLENPN